MLTLKELKQPYESLLKANNIDYKTIDCNKLASEYTTCIDDNRKNIIISALICASWGSIQNIFYKQQKSSLTAEECYDIYMEALEYILDKQIWNNKDSKLYQDKDAFKKAMTQCTMSRKINYLQAQHRQKRVANYNPISVEGVDEAFQEGYLCNTVSELVDSAMDYVYKDLDSLITDLFNNKKYLSAFVLDAVLNANVYNNDEELSFNIKKLAKHLRRINNDFCGQFAIKYSLNTDEVEYSLKYFKNLPTDKLHHKIEKVFTELRNNDIIKKVVLC